MRPVTLTLTGPGVSAVCPPDIYLNPFNLTLQTLVTGTVSYSVEYTKDDVFSPTFNPATANWIAVTAIPAASTTSKEATLISPVRGIRINNASGTGTIVLQIVQSGAMA